MRGRKRHRKKRAKWAAKHRRSGLRTIMTRFGFPMPSRIRRTFTCSSTLTPEDRVKIGRMYQAWLKTARAEALPWWLRAMAKGEFMRMASDAKRFDQTLKEIADTSKIDLDAYRRQAERIGSNE